MNGCNNFANDIFKPNLLYENCFILIENSEIALQLPKVLIKISKHWRQLELPSIPLYTRLSQSSLFIRFYPVFLSVYFALYAYVPFYSQYHSKYMANTSQWLPQYAEFPS